jgi:hypothetical protein
LGEFSPLELLFSWAIIVKITKGAQNSGLLFSTEKFCINFDKKWVWLHFFKNSPGHPGVEPT